MTISRRKLEYAWHAFAFVLLVGAFVPLWRQMMLGGIDPGEGDPVQRVFLGIAYLGVGLLVFHPRRALAMACKGWPIWLLVGWALFSTLWSVAPGITFRRSLVATLGALYGLLLVVRYKPEEVLRVLGWSLAIVTVASLIAILLFPDWAVMTGLHEGAWRGVLYHKNALGRTMVLAWIMFQALASIEQKGKTLWWRFLQVIALLLIAGSRSAGAWVLMAFVLVGLALIRVWSHLPGSLRPAAISLAFAFAMPMVTVLPDVLETVLGFLGKDLTLTGRIPLWLLLIPMALQRPLLGYGYGAFWLGESGPSAIVWALTWDAPHAHNGFLDLWLELGLVGAVLGTMVLALPMARSIFSSRRAAKIAENVFLFFVFSFWANAAESVLLQSGLAKALYWLLVSYFVHLSQVIHRSGSQL